MFALGRACLARSGLGAHSDGRATALLARRRRWPRGKEAELPHQREARALRPRRDVGGGDGMRGVLVHQDESARAGQHANFRTSWRIPEARRRAPRVRVPLLVEIEQRGDEARPARAAVGVAAVQVGPRRGRCLRRVAVDVPEEALAHLRRVRDDGRRAAERAVELHAVLVLLLLVPVPPEQRHRRERRRREADVAVAQQRAQPPFHLDDRRGPAGPLRPRRIA
mmetsp:Transcript_3237/g.8034  ORF Transcript_3237/g.8034 Transcript_3237/m.8034 type:complete len:224 (-) Transcript_3237:1054-1725(-)